MRTITIQSNQLGRYDDVSPFLVESGTLELKIMIPNFYGEFFLLTELNGKNGGAKKIPREGTVTLVNLQAGELHAAVKHYLRGELIEVYHVEPLIVKKVDAGVTVTPEITALRQGNELLCKEMNEFKERVEKTFAEARERERRRDVAFLSYAYAEYQSDVQLNSKNLTAEEFMSVLGYDAEDFTAEELEKIKNKQEEL